jgi:hypothetical protein
MPLTLVVAIDCASIPEVKTVHTIKQKKACRDLGKF